MMTVAEIMAGISASMKRSKDYWAKRAVVSQAYTGPERRRAPRIEIEDDGQEAQRLADQASPEGKP